jgi:hypothetical protein
MYFGWRSQPMKGIFELKTPADLREKMRRDLAKMKSEPLNTDHAFNFFITSEHMLDWVYPGNANKAKRTNARQNSILLEVCSHLANGAKHFEVEFKHHKSVSSASTMHFFGFWPQSFWPKSYWPNSYWPGRRKLVVKLKGDAVTQLGQVIGVIELAEKVMEYWENHPLT